MIDVAIIGSGPSGLAAAIYLLRADKTVTLFEKEAIGGQMAKSPLIENYPGLVGSGSDIADKMFAQIENDSNLNFIPSEVTSVIKTDRSFLVYTDDEVCEASKVICAIGVKHKKLPCLQEEMDHVHYCATCDGPLYKNKDVAVIGDGNAAMQYALELGNYCRSVMLLTMFDKFFGEEILAQRVIDSDKVQWAPNITVNKVEPCGNNLVLHFTNGKMMFTSAAFIAIGQQPITLPMPKMDMSNRFIVVDEHMQSTCKGFYAVGDCVEKEYRQVSLAVADGTLAALDIIKGTN